MNLSNAIRLLVVVMVTASGLGNAAHVTDKLVVGVYPQPAEEGSPLRLVSSGTPLDVLSTKGDYAEVRLADDTRGWVEARYITDEKPAKAMLLETQARLRQMGLEMAALRAGEGGREGDAEPMPSAQSLPPSAREAQLQQALDQAKQRVDELEARLIQQDTQQDAQQRLEQLQARVRDALERLAASQGLTLQDAAASPAQGFFSRYRTWIAAAGALLVGIAAGIGFVDYRIRKRYGGFRI
ncbi:MAG: hypothetical protein KDI82_04440 [Gammaproteobacteria bacterium]|nr:hypothetical protein [Gammaproteobacteria bacterium]